MVLHPHQLTPALPKIQRLHWTLCPNGQSCLDYSPTSQEQPWPSPVVLAHNPHLMQPAQPNGILSEKTAGRNFAVVLHVKNEVPFSYRLKGLISQSCAWLKTTKDEVTAARKVKRCLASVASATIARSIKTFFFLFFLFFFFCLMQPAPNHPLWIRVEDIWRRMLDFQLHRFSTPYWMYLNV